MRIEFTKMTGTGNDFLVLDNRGGLLAEADLASFAREVCPRRTAVGADGVLLLEATRSPEAAFRMRILNADGSEAEMCGNGARCIARYAESLGLVGERFVFETLAGPIRAEIDRGVPRVRLPDCAAPEPVALDAEVPGGPVGLLSVNTGVPHAVLSLEGGADALAEVDLPPFGRAVRFHEAFAPAGTNVNVMARSAEGIGLRTYERGVEDETLACGTGATAAALVAHARWGLASPVSVGVASGETLRIRFTPEANGYTDLWLEGAVRTVYEGALERG